MARRLGIIGLVAVAGWAVVAVALAGRPAAFPSEQAIGEARKKVQAFERPLVLDRIDRGEADWHSKSRRHVEKVRAFLAELDSPAMKFAAIEMFNSRFVYVVPRDAAVELLGPLVRDPDPAVRAQAVSAVAYNGGGATYAKELIAMLQGAPAPWTLTSAAHAMGRSKHQPFVPYLADMTRHADAQVRLRAATELTILSSKAAFEHNLRHLGDDEELVRRRAVQNFARGNDARAVKSIEAMLDDPSDRVREAAIWALGDLGSTSSADLIAKRLADPHVQVRAEAVQVLGQLRATRHADAVAARLEDDEVYVRRCAIRALGEMGERRFLPKLRPFLQDPDDRARESAARAVRELEQTSD